MTLPGPHPYQNDYDTSPGGAGDPGLPQRLAAMGLGEVEAQGPYRARVEGPLGRVTGLGADLGQRVSSLEARIDTLVKGLAAQEDRLRDAERSLVDRIADVDDDRRRSQGQLQRAQQSQFDEFQGALRRLGGLTTLGLLVISILAAGGGYLIHFLQTQRLEGHRGDLMGEVQTLSQELARIKGPDAQGAQQPEWVQERLVTLSSTVDQLAAELAQTKPLPPVETAPPSPGVAPLTDQIRRLESEQQGLVTEIQVLRQALESATLAGAQAPDTKKPVQSPQTQGVEIASDLPHPGVAALGNPAPGTVPDAEPRPQEAGDEAEIAAPPPPETLAPQPSFALQLMGSYDRADLLQFAARADLPPSVYLREETLRGRPWFVLIHSLHPSYAEAEAQRNRLPGRLARLDTWIRNLPANSTMEPIPTGRVPRLQGGQTRDPSHEPQADNGR